jgi:hypothetical protein
MTKVTNFNLIPLIFKMRSSIYAYIEAHPSVVKLSKKNKRFRLSGSKKNPNYEKKYHFFHSPVNKNLKRIFFHFKI